MNKCVSMTLIMCIGLTFVAPAALRAGQPSEAWVTRTGSEIRGDATIAGTDLLIACENKVVCLDQTTGSKKWEQSASKPNTPTYGNGYVFVSSDDGLACYSVATGTQKWSKSLQVGLECAPAYGDGKVVVGGEGALYCIDASTGSLDWQFRCEPTYGKPCVSEGRAYVSAKKSNLHCVSLSTGKEVWSRRIGQNIQMGAASCPVVLEDLVYIGSGDRPLGVYALDKTNGMMIFKTQTPGVITRSCVAAKQGIVAGAYFTKPGITVMDSEEGKVLWQQSTDKGIFTQPYIEGEYLYVFPTDGFILQYRLSNGTLLNSWSHNSYGKSGMGFSGSVVNGSMMFLVSRNEGVVVGIKGL